MTTKRTTIKEEARILRKILVAKIAAKRQVVARKTKSVLIRAFILANIFSFAQANAQSHGDSNKGNKYEYVEQPDGSFKVEVTNNRQATTQQSYSKASSGQQSVYDIYNSLPSYTRALIQERGYQILPEFQGGRTTGLNRPQSGVVYACAVQDPSNIDNVLFLPISQAIYPAGNRDFVNLRVLRSSKENAYNMMDLGSGPYETRREYAQTRENAQRERAAEQRNRQDDIYMDQTDVRQDREETHVKIQKNTGYGRAHGAMDGINDVNRTINRGVQTVENSVNTVKKSVKTVKRIFGRD